MQTRICLDHYKVYKKRVLLRTGHNSLNTMGITYYGPSSRGLESHNGEYNIYRGFGSAILGGELALLSNFMGARPVTVRGGVPSYMVLPNPPVSDSRSGNNYM